eukprot:gnl/Hemi2/27782_TR9178_c0_g1_i1.p2 gnl/Hemi2/27782_TR9178_c0_g1~~gnl/Hemi2/27782_TR9178_c0_g1_i1.p2  ORF type:complete len:323 (+),score=28.97 gnl/Hemi2/27782_TR9178_c0_g1_i1:33-971(+)
MEKQQQWWTAIRSSAVKGQPLEEVRATIFAAKQRAECDRDNAPYASNERIALNGIPDTPLICDASFVVRQQQVEQDASGWRFSCPVNLHGEAAWDFVADPPVALTLSGRAQQQGPLGSFTEEKPFFTAYGPMVHGHSTSCVAETPIHISYKCCFVPESRRPDYFSMGLAPSYSSSTERAIRNLRPHRSIELPMLESSYLANLMVRVLDDSVNPGVDCSKLEFSVELGGTNIGRTKVNEKGVLYPLLPADAVIPGYVAHYHILRVDCSDPQCLFEVRYLAVYDPDLQNKGELPFGKTNTIKWQSGMAGLLRSS